MSIVTWNEDLNEKGQDAWAMHHYFNEGVIGRMRLDLEMSDLVHWYPAFMKIKDFLYPVLFKAPIEYNRRNNPYDSSRYPGSYIMDFGPIIKDNEICVSRQVLESMIWRGFLITFTLENGVPKFRSPLDGNQNCTHYNEAIDVEIIPYDFTADIGKYFDSRKSTNLNRGFQIHSVGNHNSLVNSVYDLSHKSMKLDKCFLGEQGTALRIFLDDDICSMLKKEDLCYFLSFTSNGSVDIIYDRQKIKEQKILQMETPKSIEEAQMEYFDYVKTLNDKDVKVEIDDKKVEEIDELLI